MSRSSDNGAGPGGAGPGGTGPGGAGGPGGPAGPGRSLTPHSGGRSVVTPHGQPPQHLHPQHSPYAEQEAFDGAYDNYGDPLTGPPSRDPRLPDQRGDQRGLGSHGGGHSAGQSVGQYVSQYPAAGYGVGAPSAPAAPGQQPYDPYEGSYQVDARFAADPRQPDPWPDSRPDPRPAQRPDAYGRSPLAPPQAAAGPGSLRAMLPPQQPVSLQPGPPPQQAPSAPVNPRMTVPGGPPSAPVAAEADLEPDTQRPVPSANREMYAPARSDQTDKNHGNAPIVPAGSVTGRSLTLVISIMCFLACLTAGAVYMMNQSASAWLKDIASEVTVQVEGRDKADSEKVLNEVAAFLNQQPGIVKARVLSLSESGGLLEPWIGNVEALKTLAVPRLIALELDRRTPPDLDPLRAKLASTFKGVFLDDHRQWQTQIRTVTRSFALGGLAILLLVAAATTAIIISATRAAMASNREIVEVLHFVGATDRFIAREFERNFLRLGVRAGLVGAVSAMVVFALMPTLMELLGGGTVSLAEMRRLVGSGNLDMVGYGLLAALVFVVAALCMLTSRFSVYRILHARQ